jgi:predicted  nucleic acid-binding Zn-ribbon protein
MIILTSKRRSSGESILKTGLVTLIIGALAAPAVRAGDPPEEINVPKYLAIYQNAKKISDAKRARANDLLTQAQAIDAQIAGIKQRISTQVSTLESHRITVARLEQENPQLLSRNQILSGEVNSHQSEISHNTPTVQRLFQELQSLYTRIQQEENAASTLKTKLTQITTRLNQAERAVSEHESNLYEAKLDLSRATDRRSDAQYERQTAASTLDAIRVDLEQSTWALQEARNRLPGLERAKINAQNSYNSKLQELRPLQNRINEAKNQVAGAQRALTSAKDNLESVTLRLRQITQRMGRVQSQVANLDAEIARLEASEQTPEVEQKLSQLRNQRAGVVSELASLTEEKERADNERHTAQDLVTRETDRLNGFEQILASAQQEYNSSQGNLQVLESELREAKQEYESTSQEGRQLESRVSELTSRKSTLQNSFNQLNNEIAELDRRIPGLQREVADQEILLSRARNTAYDLSRERDSVNSELVRQNQVVSGLQTNYSNLERQYESLNERTEYLKVQVEEKKREITRNNSTYQQNTATIAQLKSEIPRVESEISQLRNQLPALQTKSTNAWAAYRPVDEDAKLAEAETARTFSKYSEVKALYDSRMQAARESGTSQGETQGRQEGDSKGTSDGQSVGTQEGTAKGQSEGLAFGLEKGRVEGTKQGDTEGYQHGLNVPENYKLGLQEGLIQGEKDAWTFARQTEFPRGRATRRAELLAKPPTKLIEIDNRIAVDASRWVSEVRTNLENARGSLFFDVAGNEGRVDSNTLVRPSFFKQTAVDLNKPNCQHGWVEFDDACLASFKIAYQAAYQVAYAASYKVAHNLAFKAAHTIAFEKNRDVKYQEGFKTAYPIAYAAGDLRGARDAKNKGYNDGKTEAYNKTVGPAKAAEFDRGLNEESAHFAKNPVIRMLGEIITETGEHAGDIVAGDTISLSLDAANFGAIASQRGFAKAQWVALSNNVAVQGGVVDLAAIPATTRAKINHVSLAKVDPNAKAGSVVQLKVIMTTADGDTQETTLSANVVAHLPMKIEELETEENPTIGKAYDFKVKVRNSSGQNAFNDIRVLLSSTEPSTVVRVDKAEAILKLLKNEKSDDTKLKYTVVASNAAGRDVTLTVTVFHGRNVSARGTLVIKPKLK